MVLIRVMVLLQMPTCDYNNDPTITMDSTASLIAGGTVSGTGIPASATIASNYKFNNI